MVVQFSIENRCAFIRLNRPEKRNALNPELVEALQKAFEEAIQSASVRVIQLEGEGSVFCAGADLAALKEMRAYSDRENEADSERLARLFLTIYSSPKPVIAVVKGAALAGGCGLATVCDITIASKTAKFGYTETRLGFIPAIVSVFLVRKVSETQVRRLLLAAEIIEATEAQQIGLITEAVEESELANRAAYWREALSSRVSAQAVIATKKLIESAYTMSFSDAIENAIRANVKARTSDDCRNGVDQFLEGNKVSW